ncbi:MAG: sigma-70 family RNA polymerase sigma factor [Clostridia bacterium]|nr:sigma-70 family RNA polymerase sigma factor [Clostridia bacterium]
MEDKRIVDLYWARSEAAISETAKKYGKLCYSVAYNILRNTEDSEECVNDTYLGAWNAMPDQRPDRLTAFLARITRCLAINKYERNNAKKRGGGQIPLVLDELSECIASDNSAEDGLKKKIFAETINSFLDGLSEKNRDIFVSRYWEMCSAEEIARIYGMNENAVKVALHRMREKLKELLKKEGLF